MAASLFLQLGVASLLVILPLMHPEMLRLQMEIPVWVPLKPIQKSAPTPTEVAPHTKASAPTHYLSVLTAPTKVPQRISVEPDAPQGTPAMLGVPVLAGGGSGIPGVSDSLPIYTAPTQPAPVAKRPDGPKGPVHISSGVQGARLIFGPHPLYPSLARAARQQGTVRIQAVIARDGTIQNLNVMSGPALLIPAALAAVKQWRYQPTLLSGEAVEVATEIEVTFTLNQ